MGEILPEAFALLKETARRWAQNGEIRVTVSDRDRELAATKDFVVIEGDQQSGRASGMLPGLL